MTRIVELTAIQTRLSRVDTASSNRQTTQCCRMRDKKGITDFQIGRRQFLFRRIFSKDTVVR